MDMNVFCFAERAHAEQFRERFGGEFIDPRTGRSGRARRDRSLHGRQCREDLRIPGFCQRSEGTLSALQV
jgi:hypothetical protein